ncbi:response regulator transcription factor [Georgenia alba]|uniref:Response regulator transcription factor n=1 Tax=Georgenia alba TaxID=2233858 RepID=A0ABW2QAT9_9MICO
MNASTRATATAAEGRLLVVDDEPSIRELLSASLKFAGFEVVTAEDGNAALRAAAETPPDLVVLDIMLPDMDGFTVLRRLRAHQADVPVLFLTARDDMNDKVQGLTVGGDDYVTKPFSLEEVVARIRAVLRRSRPPAEDDGTLTYADLELDEDAHEVRRAGQPVDLSPTEFKLLRYLMINAERVVSKAQILDHVWDYDFTGEPAIVESYISYLRRKIDSAEHLGLTGAAAEELVPLVHTRRGVGYVLRRPPGR